MKVFILGAKGFVGSAFVRYCQAKKIEFAAIDKNNYHRYISKSCDILINANGNSKKFLAEQNPALDFKLSFLSVEKSLQDFKTKKYIYISSIDVYNNVSNPKENKEETRICVSRQSFYGFHKYLAEQIVKKYTREWLIVRCGGFVGQGLKKNSVFDILNYSPLRVHISSQYQYLPVDELPKIVFFLIKKRVFKEIFNVCGKGLMSLNEAAVLIPNYKLRYAANNNQKEVYNININKLNSLYRVPSTAQSVKEFINTPIRGESILL